MNAYSPDQMVVFEVFVDWKNVLCSSLSLPPASLYWIIIANTLTGLMSLDFLKKQFRKKQSRLFVWELNVERLTYALWVMT